ncbi:MAG: ribonuclease H-like domain-containing protein [archaeon]
MGNYYLDIETTGLNPDVDEILTIQYQELGRNTGMPVGDLVILKAWESSEKNIIEKFLDETSFLDAYDFSFVPVGYNLSFEHNFLKRRAEIHGLPEIDILSKPFIDLRVVGILMKGGEFKGSGLNKITGKDRDGMMVPIWFDHGDYDKIVEYIEMEAREFLKFCVWLYRRMPELFGEWVSGF